MPLRAFTPRDINLKFAAALRRCTCSKWACFHSKVILKPLYRPLQTVIRFLLLPLPPAPWPLLALRLPIHLCGCTGDAWGLPRFSKCPFGWLSDDRLRDVLSAARVGEPIAVHDRQWPTWCLLATAPSFARRNKRKLFTVNDGSIERSLTFPIPFTLACFDCLA